MAAEQSFKRVLLKLSGEALASDGGTGIDPDRLRYFANQIRYLYEKHIEMGLVIGGGNIFRGANAVGITRVSGDYMGMLATIINALALQDVLNASGMPTEVFTPFEMPAFASRFNASMVISALRDHRLTIFAGGTGNPYFSTDSGAALRAAEIRADVLIKATKVDGVFSADPLTDATAHKFDRLTYQEMLENNFKVIDATAVALCREVRIPIFICNLKDENSFKRLARGELDFGTWVS